MNSTLSLLRDFFDGSQQTFASIFIYLFPYFSNFCVGRLYLELQMLSSFSRALSQSFANFFGDVKAGRLEITIYLFLTYCAPLVSWGDDGKGFLKDWYWYHFSLNFLKAENIFAWL